MTNKTEVPRKPIEGRVAQILNERELVINVGGEGGVLKGMKFAVLSEQPLEIKDPTTGNVLDVIDREKVRVEAHEVRRKITICRTFRTTGSPYDAIREMAELTRFGRTKEETLRADDHSLPKPLSPEESYVKVNDRVVEVNS